MYEYIHWCVLLLLRPLPLLMLLLACCVLLLAVYCSACSLIDPPLPSLTTRGNALHQPTNIDHVPLACATDVVQGPRVTVVREKQRHSTPQHPSLLPPASLLRRCCSAAVAVAVCGRHRSCQQTKILLLRFRASIIGCSCHPTKCSTQQLNNKRGSQGGSYHDS